MCSNGEWNELKRCCALARPAWWKLACPRVSTVKATSAALFVGSSAQPLPNFKDVIPCVCSNSRAPQKKKKRSCALESSLVLVCFVAPALHIRSRSGGGRANILWVLPCGSVENSQRCHRQTRLGRRYLAGKWQAVRQDRKTYRPGSP